MGLIGDIMYSLRFKDTVFYKESSDLKDIYEALIKLRDEYPENDDILKEFYNIKKGLDGENEIAYQLKKANIGMYVLKDIKLKHEDLTAQIDYIIITPVYTYYVECKNLVGNIKVNEKGDFIRELFINGKKISKGMYSPLRQVEAQREVVRKIWESNVSKIKKVFEAKYFEDYRKVLVVAANQDTILNTDKAPRDIKYKILRADALIRKIQYDLDHRSRGESYCSKKFMEEIAQDYINLSIKGETNYYEYYKTKYCEEEVKKQNDLKERLIELRKSRSKEMNVPAFYVFNNDELDRLVLVRPKTIEELKNANILTSVKIKTHGEQIINEINK